MDRDSTQHAPESDEHLACQAKGLVPGGGTTHAQESTEPEPTHRLTDRAQAQPPPQRAPGAWPGMTPQDGALRNKLADLLATVVFPADREKLLWHLEHRDVPGPAFAAVASLPGKREFHSVDDVAEALGLQPDAHRV